MPHARRALALAFALIWALCCVPCAGASPAEAGVGRDAGVSAGQHADLGVRLHVAGTAAVANDPRYRWQWAFENSGDTDIDLAAAWSNPLDRLGHDVDVAVVDQRVNTSHPDLAGRVVEGPSFVGDTTCAVVAPVGANDHGTHVAGTIAAARDGKGTVGVAPDARIVSLPAFDNCGDSDSDSDRVIEAFKYAGKHDIPIVVASFASDPLEQLTAAATESDFAAVFEQYPETLFVVAAGNEGNDNGERRVFPCDTRLWRTDPPNVVCVGMSNDADAPDCLSNVGGSVDLFAPGVAIWSTVAQGWAALTGTSMSAAMVAGVAALAKSTEPSWTGPELKDALLAGVDPIDAMTSISYSGGRLNAARTLSDSRVAIGGGSGGTWVSCDRDHDGVRDEQDKCPALVGTQPLKGCPDADGGVSGKAVDDCPQGVAKTANGCPAPEITPTPGPAVTYPPAVVSTPIPTPVAPAALRVRIAVKVSRKAARVTIKPTRTARVSIKVERLVKKKWRRVSRRSLTAGAAGRSLTFRRLVRGSYRVTATATGVRLARRFKV